MSGLQVETVPVDSLSPDPSNVRRHPERNLETIKASLRRFGQQKPIVVDAKGIVRAGNGTLEAAKALGWDKIAVVRSDLAGSEATAFAIADNRSAELAEWDGTALAEQLRSLQSEDFDLDAVGYDDDEIAGMIDGLGNDLISIADESAGSSASLDYLSWGDHKIPITGEEAAMLGRALDRHRKSSGTSYGFVLAVLGDV